MLYFAYGSNLDRKQMRERCPGARYAFRGRLLNFTLSFRGYSERWHGSVATVLPWAGAWVDGVLYNIDARDLDRLDRFEGYPHVYDRRRKIILTACARRVFAHVYLQLPSRFNSPGPEYLGVIERAYKRYNFDTRPLTVAAWGLS